MLGARDASGEVIFALCRASCVAAKKLAPLKRGDYSALKWRAPKSESDRHVNDAIAPSLRRWIKAEVDL
jgi:hypothetical protein